MKAFLGLIPGTVPHWCRRCLLCHFAPLPGPVANLGDPSFWLWKINSGVLSAGRDFKQILTSYLLFNPFTTFSNLAGLCWLFKVLIWGQRDTLWDLYVAIVHRTSVFMMFPCFTFDWQFASVLAVLLIKSYNGRKVSLVDTLMTGKPINSSYRYVPDLQKGPSHPSWCSHQIAKHISENPLWAPPGLNEYLEWT